MSRAFTKYPPLDVLRSFRRSLKHRIGHIKYRRLLRDRPNIELVTSGDYLWFARLQPDISEGKARKENTRFVFQLLKAAEIPFFVIPSESGRRYSIAVHQRDWDTLCSVLRDQPSTPQIGIGIRTTNAAGKSVRKAVPVDSVQANTALFDQSHFEIFHVFVAEAGGKLYGRPYGCVVERWNTDALGNAYTEARNPRGAVIDIKRFEHKEIDVYGESAPTYSPLILPSVFDTRRDIDIVYMWVNHDDPAWRDKRRNFLKGREGHVDPRSMDEARFRDNGELRYSLRSVFEHLEDVRNIYLVTDDQVPDWMSTEESSVKIVDHKELFGDAGQLPTYNSHAIAARLHHIEGLAENYLIFNDDIFLGQDIDSSSFFTPNGMSKFFLSRSTLPLSNVQQTPHEAARHNVFRLLANDFGKAVSRNFFHTPVPQLRSLMYELEDRYEDQFRRNWSSQLRDVTDYEINGWLHHYYGYLKGRSVPGRIDYDYFDASDSDFQQRLLRLSEQRDLATFCINDNPAASATNLAFISEWLQRYFPRAAPWEDGF